MEYEKVGPELTHEEGFILGVGGKMIRTGNWIACYSVWFMLQSIQKDKDEGSKHNEYYPNSEKVYSIERLLSRETAAACYAEYV